VSKILQVQELTRIFKSGSRELAVVNKVNFDIDVGSVNAIVGPSGSGKTTLLGLCAGLDTPTSGEVILQQIPLASLSEDERAKIRNEYIGFVFQTFQLIPTLTAIENVMVPLELRGDSSRKVRERAKELLNEVGLADRTHHYPTQLSGGEQQRVAIARAFINKPKILFADEPTGNLDTETGQHIEHLIFNLNKSQKTTLVLVTHDLELAEKCNRIIKIKNGKIDSDTRKAIEKVPQL
jgi:putative ABC transport system ATP-binding protein